MQSYINLVSNLQTAESTLLADLLEERGRYFASDREAWAQLKENLERAEEAIKAAKKLHGDMWEAIKSGEQDLTTALLQEAERSGNTIAGYAMQLAANAKIAALNGSEDCEDCRIGI